MHPFDHHTPDTLSAALELLAQTNGQGEVIAGGSDLLLKMRDGALQPTTLINIKRLQELQGIAYDEQAGLHLGALTTLRELTRSPVVIAHYPVLAETASLMASEQIRCFATVGGNLCNAAPSADLTPPLMALGGVAILEGPGGERRLSLEDFFLGPGETVLRPNELLRAVLLPPPRGKTIYIKHSQRAFMDIALVGVATRVIFDGPRIHDIRLVLGAVAPVAIRPRRAEHELTGQIPTPDRIERAARVAVQESSPVDDVRCSRAYRRQMVGVLVRRLLQQVSSTG